MKKIVALFLFTAIATMAFAQVKKTTTTKPAARTTVKKPIPKPVVKQKADTSTKVKITTSLGIIVVKLYDSTPLHKANFIKLVKQGFYDSLMFHRVMPQFMIQGGDPLSKNAPSGSMLGMGGGDMERIPAEFIGSYIHKRGALAGASDGNPQKASSACQFYIVEGMDVTDEMLNMFEAQSGKKYTPAQRATYKVQGGYPSLDNNYVVFGETVSGFDVITKIISVPRDGANRPYTDLRMKMEIIK